MNTQHTAGPWSVIDLRATTMRALGWRGEQIDCLLISCKGDDLEGGNCVVARIAFDNRPEELGDGNFADACLIAAAPGLLASLIKARNTLAGSRMEKIAADICDAAIAKATGQ
jgi:hypothetical protein